MHVTLAQPRARDGFADGRGAMHFTLNRYKARAIAHAINRKNDAELGEPSKELNPAVNVDEHSFDSIGDVAARIVGRLQEGRRP